MLLRRPPRIIAFTQGNVRQTWLERLLERLYRRTGPRYPEALVAVLIAWIMLVVCPAYTALLFPYFGTTWEQFLRITLGFEIALVPASIGVVIIAYRLLRPALPWARGERTIQAAEAAWTAVVRELHRLVVRSVVWILPCTVPAAIHAADIVGLSFWGLVLYVVVIFLLIVGAGVIVYLFLEQAVRPVMRELVGEFPLQFGGRSSGLSLNRKLLVLLPLINLYTGMIVAAVSTNSLGLEGRLAITVASAVVVTVTLTLGLTVLLRNSLLNRLEDLRTAMRRVDGGDYGAHVPPLAGDELDEVGHSFNEMVDRLRRHEDDMRESRARIVAAGDAGRRRVERDLHDGAQQHLVLLQLKLALARRVAETDPAKVTAALDDARAELDTALRELRDLAHGIYPAVLESDGLPGALREAVTRVSIRAKLECDGAGRYPPELEAAVYFCCLEALQNASKHAGDDARAVVRLAERNGDLEFEVADDGQGCDMAAVGNGAGLQNMTDRLGALGGNLRITSRPGTGTRIAGRVPVR